jgi:hypothetical protein
MTDDAATPADTTAADAAAAGAATGSADTATTGDTATPADATAAAGAATGACGALIDQCAIDLPPNDVVEAIEFERFFRINATLGNFQRPVTMVSAWLSMSSISTQEVAELAPQFATGAPLSNDIAVWEHKPSALETLREFMAPPAERAQPFEAVFQSAAQVTGPVTEIAQAPLAFYLPYRQEWKLCGYSRGRMVSSLTLGPQEEQTIEIFKWDRFTRTFDSTTSFEMEETSETSGTRRDTTDISHEIARQAGFELTTGAKVGFKVGVVNADFSGGTDAKTGLNDAEKEAYNSITEATSRAATSVRSSRVLKVAETREAGEETRVTRKLRNRNACHTLTTTFFEILANYTVSTLLKADGIRLVVLLGSSELKGLIQFDRDTVRAHERSLMLALLDSTLAPGFEAARYLDARDRSCSILCERCDCGFQDELAAGTQWQELVTALASLDTVIATLRAYTVLFPLSVGLAIVEPPGGGPGSADIKRYAFRRALARHAPRLLADLGGLGLSSGSITPAMAASAQTIIGSIPAHELDALRASEGRIAEEVGWQIFGALFAITPGDPISKAITAGIATGILIAKIGGITYIDDGLLAAIDNVRAKYAAWQAYVTEQRLKQAKAAELERIAREERALRVLDAYPLRTTAEAQERLDALLDHLNDPRNVDHYRFAVWNERGGSSDEQLLQLAVAGFTEGAPVGVVGDRLAVPVRIPPGTSLEKFFTDSIVDLKSMSPRDDDEHILPTAALYAEAAVGTCLACEPAIVQQEALELERRATENAQMKEELKLIQARIQAGQLGGDGNAPPVIRVELRDAAAAGATPQS